MAQKLTAQVIQKQHCDRLQCTNEAEIIAHYKEVYGRKEDPRPLCRGCYERQDEHGQKYYQVSLDHIEVLPPQ